MPGRDETIQRIMAFLSGDGRVFLLTGTNINRKHVLAIQAALAHRCRVLFRSSAKINTESFLAPAGVRRVPTARRPVGIEGSTLHADTINPRSWGTTPQAVDIAVVYAADALDERTGERCVRDLLARGAKVVLVGWMDNVDWSWVDQFRPIRAAYDAADENPALHSRVEEQVAPPAASPPRVNLPKYARGEPWRRLARILCRGNCGKQSWARLNHDYPGAEPLRLAEMGAFSATCLKCGHVAHDNYNWGRN